MLRLYWTNVRNVPQEAGELPLSAYRLKKLESLVPPQSRRQSIAAELLLIKVLHETDAAFPLPLNIDTAAGGKPFLRESPLQFSLSHSGDFASCALSDGQIGLDIQVERPFPDGFLKRFFHPQERDFVLSSGNQTAAFTEIWTRKESFLKLSGAGLSQKLSAFSVLSLPAVIQSWHTCLDCLHLAICTRGSTAEPESIRRISREELMGGLCSVE